MILHLDCKNELERLILMKLSDEIFGTMMYCGWVPVVGYGICYLIEYSNSGVYYVPSEDSSFLDQLMKLEAYPGVSSI